MNQRTATPASRGAARQEATPGGFGQVPAAGSSARGSAPPAFGHEFGALRVRAVEETGPAIQRDDDGMFGGFSLPSMDDVANGVASVGSSIGSGISGLGSGISDTIGGVGSTVGSAVEGIDSFIGGGISGAGHLAGNAVSTVGGLFGRGSIGEGLGNVIGPAVGGVGDVLGGAVTNMGKTANANSNRLAGYLGGGIGSTSSWLGDAVSGGASGAGAFLQGLPGLDPSMIIA